MTFLSFGFGRVLRGGVSKWEARIFFQIRRCVEICGVLKEIGILLPNNQRKHRSLHIQEDVLPYALC